MIALRGTLSSAADILRPHKGRRRPLVHLPLVVFVLLMSCSAEQEPRYGGQQHGFALPTWTRTGYDGPEMGKLIGEVEELGANWIQLVPTAYQDIGHASTMTVTSPKTVSDEGLTNAILLAHERGMQVLLKPSLEVVDSPGSHAEIRPDNRDSWFTSYTSFINHYANIAARLHVEQFSIGTELSAVSDDPDRWLAVIGAVRARYQGMLLYAANFDEYARVPFWAALDLIGIDAYWPLSSAPTSDSTALKRAWRPITAELSAFAQKNDRRILFTEAGYTSAQGTTTRPYSWTISQVPDQAEQAAAYEALLASLHHQPWWAGVFWWTWQAVPDDGGDHTLDFTARAKVAADVVRRWWDS